MKQDTVLKENEKKEKINPPANREYGIRLDEECRLDENAMLVKQQYCGMDGLGTMDGAVMLKQ